MNVSGLIIQIMVVKIVVLPVDVSPKESLYYIGGVVLDILKKSNQRMGFVDLFSELNKELKLSINLFILVLDWLFLVEAAVVEDDGVVRLCI